MYTSFRSWGGALILALTGLQSVTARVPSLEPRDSPSALQTLIASGGNVFSYEQDGINYNLTLQTDPNCPNALNESSIFGPYQDSKGRQIENATLGDIANDVQLTPVALLYRSTRRNMIKAQHEVDDLLSEVLLCDNKDYQFGVQVHDELRRKLLQQQFHRYGMAFITCGLGFVCAAGATWAVETVITAPAVAFPIAAGFIAFFAIFFASGVHNIHADFNDRPRAEFLIMDALSAFAMRTVLTIRRLAGRGALPVAMVGGGIAAVGGGDVEMGNGGPMNGHGNGNLGDKFRRDGSATNAVCVPAANATASMFELSSAKSEDIGLLSWSTLSQAAGTCHM